MAAASEMLAGGFMLLVLGVLLKERLHGVPPLRSTVALLYFSIAGSVVAFSAYLYLLQRVSPALATSYTYINPAIALWLGILFAGETITRTELAAVALILCGVAVLVLGAQGAPGRRGSPEPR